MLWARGWTEGFAGDGAGRWTATECSDNGERSKVPDAAGGCRPHDPLAAVFGLRHRNGLWLWSIVYGMGMESGRIAWEDAAPYGGRCRRPLSRQIAVLRRARRNFSMVRSWGWAGNKRRLHAYAATILQSQSSCATMRTIVDMR